MVVAAQAVLAEGDDKKETRTRAAPASGMKAGRDPGREEVVMARCDAAIDIIAALFDLPGRELRRAGRSTTDIARVRQIAMYVAHVVLQLNMGEVGRGFGRDRTTVLHACHLIEDLRDDPEFDRIVATAERVTKAVFAQNRS